MTIRSKRFSVGGLLADICTQERYGPQRPFKKINMIRICFTAIAYIISFLSHSNELDVNSDTQVFSEQHCNTEYVIHLDSLKEEGDLDLNDLN